MPNVKQIRTSIIGPEINNKVSLMEWFFKQKENANGYTNHYWNGITTLEWSKQAYKIVNNWNEFDKVTQIGTVKISKYELLCLLNKVFETNKNIVPINVDMVNKCLKTDYCIQSLEDQLIELKKFY
jgi:dTDP-4-dehydrorhamnose reductase